MVSFRRLALTRLTVLLSLVMSVCPLVWSGSPGGCDAAGAEAAEIPMSCCLPVEAGSCPESQPVRSSTPMRGCQGCPDPARRGAPMESQSCRTCQASLPQKNDLRIAERTPESNASRPLPAAATSSTLTLERRGHERRLDVRSTSPPVHLLAVVFRN